ncbi:MAG: hypothetical protein ACJAYC_000126 [Halieaceae bacterium]|jgi:hypothetical protein
MYTPMYAKGYIGPYKCKASERTGTLATGPTPGGKTYDAIPDQTATTVSVVDGQQVVIQRKTGRDYSL